MVRASEMIMACLMGAVPHNELPAACQSAISFEYYRAACAVLELPNSAAQFQALEKIPDTCREQVRAECSRIFNIRKAL